MENNDLGLVKKLRQLPKTPAFKTILNYFAHKREVPSKSSDVYSVLKYASQNGETKFSAIQLKEFFRTLHVMGIGRFHNTRQFDWLTFNPINVCRVALGEEETLRKIPESGFVSMQRRKKQRSQLISDLENPNTDELSSFSESELVDELERRGWRVSLQRKQNKS